MPDSVPVDPPEFSGFIISLATTAQMHLNGAPGQGVDLELARETIGILAMLEEKTAGNLTSEETKLLTGVLFQLRMDYVRRESSAG